jgi:hypothetical protein
VGVIKPFPKFDVPPPQHRVLDRSPDAEGVRTPRQTDRVDYHGRDISTTNVPTRKFSCLRQQHEKLSVAIPKKSLAIVLVVQKDAAEHTIRRLTIDAKDLKIELSAVEN